MTLQLTVEESAIAGGRDGQGAAMAMRIVATSASLLGAPRLIPIQSAHIDGALYHGDSGTLLAERLVAGGARVKVRSTLNVGALDLTGCSHVRLAEPRRGMARRMMEAYRELGCEQSWTCAPYQAGHRPAFGTDVAWGESNAVVFCNSVLGARTNRYGDFLDIACAIAARAPDYGLHRQENRGARLVFDVSALPRTFLDSEIAWPVLGSLYGREVGDAVGVIAGMAGHPGEDALKAFGAAAASSGAVGLFHIAGITPEAPDLETALGGKPADMTIQVTPAMVADARARLSTTVAPDQIDAVAIGSPHLSLAEFVALERLLAGRRLRVPLYACTGRHVVTELDRQGRREALEAAGVTVVADTCVVVTPILAERSGGVLMTNSGKFAHYAPGNTGYAVLYGSLAECVESAVAGRPVFLDLAGQEWRTPTPYPSPQEGGELGRISTTAQEPASLQGTSAARSSSPLRGGGVQTEPAKGNLQGNGATAQILVSGAPGTGEALILTAPISFWGGVDPASGCIADVRHPQCGESVSGRVLFLPGTIGSSSASAVLLELAHNGHAPAALVLHEPDAILLLGLIVAREMDWPTPMAVRLDRARFETFKMTTVSVAVDGSMTLANGGGLGRRK
ncbi:MULTISPECIES: aconitase X [unclassified Mesorhizobium]|uniref:aconitase X n=1 Tax=Mesorhizobium sp. Root1471 TaxID=1736469 RepID=UPI000A801457